MYCIKRRLKQGILSMFILNHVIVRQDLTVNHPNNLATIRRSFRDSSYTQGVSLEFPVVLIGNQQLWLHTGFLVCKVDRQ